MKYTCRRMNTPAQIRRELLLDKLTAATGTQWEYKIKGNGAARRFIFSTDQYSITAGNFSQLDNSVFEFLRLGKRRKPGNYGIK